MTDRAPEVAIIGGGVMGCSIALALRARGISAVVFERSVPGAEASSAAAGILGAQAEAHAPGPLVELCLASRALFPELSQRLRESAGIDVEYRRSGVLRLALDDDALASLRAEVVWQRERGLEVEVLGPSDLRDHATYLSPEARGGVLFRDDARIDPPRYLRALRIAAEREGARFSSGHLVRRVSVASGKATGIELESGERIAAGAVVVAAGSWSGLVEGGEVGRGVIRPARGQIVELETPSPLVERVIFGPGAYLSPRDDGRLLVGSTLEFVGFERAVTAGAVSELLAAAIAIVPGLAGAEFRRAWSSFRPYTRDELPLICPALVDGLFLATGHYRNGILLSPITGSIVAALIANEPPPIDVSAFAMRSFELGG